MDDETLNLATRLVSKSYIEQGNQQLTKRRKLIKSLLSERRLPQQGWDDLMIEFLLQSLASMDSNNFLSKAGVGEREGRVCSELVSRRHFGMAHGIGRSGDISAEQPKAAGSSLMAKLAALLAQDALSIAGLKDLGPVLVLPLATGMALTMTLLAAKQLRPIQARFVIWPRIDQKTCLKCICSANLVPIVIENVLIDDHLETDCNSIENAIYEYGIESIVCVLSTSSCFAPRGCDDLKSISKLCQKHNIPHIINNAYGVQSSFLCNEITTASRVGRLDAIVQSTDKNFMVPVGGSILTGPKSNTQLIDTLNRTYPGRASASSHLDLFITLLHLGQSGWIKVLSEREEMYVYLKESMERLGSKLGESVIENPRNPISLALTLDKLVPEKVTLLGSMLFTRNVSGTRVITKVNVQKVSGIEFQGYGGHCKAYPHQYLTMAAAIGIRKIDVDIFVQKLESVYCEIHNQHSLTNKNQT